MKSVLLTTLSRGADEAKAMTRASRRYGEVIAALLWREVDRRRDAPAESITAMFEPVIILMGVALVYWILERTKSPVGGSPVLFFATGLYAKYYFLHVSQRVKATTKVGRFPVELWIDHVIVHTILKFTDYMILGAVLIVVIAATLDVAAIPFDPSKVFEAMGLLTMLGFGWGVIIQVFSKVFRLGRFVFAFINRLMIWLAGAFFVVDFLPPETRHWLSYLPTMHAVILFRQGFYPNYPSLTLDMDYLIWCSIGSVVVGFVLERGMRRRLGF
jgi:capsular polysaccharide transport system permease protein